MSRNERNTTSQRRSRSERSVSPSRQRARELSQQRAAQRRAELEETSEDTRRRERPERARYLTPREKAAAARAARENATYDHVPYDGAQNERITFETDHYEDFDHGYEDEPHDRRIYVDSTDDYPLPGGVFPYLTLRMIIACCALELIFIIGLFLRDFDPIMLIEKALLGFILLWVSTMDLQSRIVPNVAIITGAVIRVLYVVIALISGTQGINIVWSSLIGLVVLGALTFGAALLSEKFFGRIGLGGGDVKLMALAGLYFGMEGGLLVLLFACIAALAFALFRPSEDGTIPFAPAISLACAIVALI